MEFHKQEFFLFFIACFLVYPWLSRRGQNGFLVGANVVFYLASGLADSSIFAFVLVANYLLARRIAGHPDWRTLFAGWLGANLIMLASGAGLAGILALLSGTDVSGFAGFVGRDFLLWNGIIAGWAVLYALLTRLPTRASVWTAVLLNLANLATFKYATFLLGNAASLSTMVGLDWTPPDVTLWLPLGISFYSFQIMAYQIDLSRQQAQAPAHFGQFALFIAFFPQLIAGPILRAHQFLPQLQERRRITMGHVKMGALFILWGLVKKVVFGDTIATMIDPLWRDVGALTTAQAWLAAIGFSFQIYFDFSGYSDIAVGLGYAFGFQLPRNFHQPYLSRDPREFWQRWHVTLSRWLRDYLYITLGGSRGSRTATLRNLMLTMLLGGLWHGASWTFVIWGGLHGVWLVLHRVWAQTPLGTRLRERGGVPYRALCHVLVAVMLVVTWVFFRASSATEAVTLLRAMVAFTGGGASTILMWVLAGTAVLHVLEQFVFEDIARTSARWHRIWAPVRGFVYAATWLLIVIFQRDEAPFIYFRF